MDELVEIKINEIFEYKGSLIKCILDLDDGEASCKKCIFDEDGAFNCPCFCNSDFRKDKQEVVFIKL